MNFCLVHALRDQWRTSARAWLGTIVVVLGLVQTGQGAVAGQSLLDDFDPRPNDFVEIIVVQPDGKILVGGAFTEFAPDGGSTIARNHIARFNPDGTIDSDFNPNANDRVYSIAVQSDGHILVGGAFSQIGGQTRNHIARLDPITGLVDPLDSFNPNANDSIFAFALQNDGKVLVGGAFTNIGAQPRNRIARLDPTTGLADTFNPNSNGSILSIALQADGKVLAGGTFGGQIAIGGQSRNFIARLNPVTGLADSFNPNANNIVFSIALQPDAKIVAGGWFDQIGGEPRKMVARLDPITGAADSFGAANLGDNDIVESVAVLSDGRIVAGGRFANIGGQARNNLARLDPLTGLADMFDPSPNLDVLTVALQQDSKILIGGYFTTVAGQPRNYLARLNNIGPIPPPPPPPTPTPTPAPILVDSLSLPVGTIYTSTNSVSLPLMVSSINPADNLVGFQGEITFDERVVTFQDPPVSASGITAGNSKVSGTILPGKDYIRTLRIVVEAQDGAPLSGTGTFLSLNFAAVSHVVGETSVLAWNWGFPPHELTFFDGDGNSHAPGNALAGSVTIALEAINISGHLAACSIHPGPVSGVTMNLSGSSNAIVLSTDSGNYQFSALASSGTYTITPSKAPRPPGSLTGLEGINMVDVIAILRHVLNFGTPLSGCRLAAADVNGDNAVNMVDLMAVLQFYLGGAGESANVGQYQFSPPALIYSNAISNQTGQNFEALVFGDVAAPFGDWDIFFDPNPNDYVKNIIPQPDGKILISGYFSTLSPNGGPAVPRQGIARLHPDGTIDNGFDPNVNGSVVTMALQPDGKILIGGGFSAVAGQTRNYVARLNSDGTLDSAFNPDVNDIVFAVAVQPDSKILISGWFTTIGGQPHPDMARLDPVTGAPDSFVPNLQGVGGRPAITNMLVQPDGKVLLAGYFSGLLGQLYQNLARMNPDGTPDPVFFPLISGGAPFADVFAIALQPDGDVLLGGAFTTINGISRYHIARLDGTTGAPDSFDPNVPDIFDNVLSIAVQEDGMVIAGGRFSSEFGEITIGGQVRNYLARLGAVTGSADSFDPNPNSVVASLLILPNGKILAGGAFSNIGGQPRSCLARLDFESGLAGRMNPERLSDRTPKLPSNPVVNPCMINYPAAVRAGFKCAK